MAAMRRTFTLLRTLGRGAHGSVHLAEMHDAEDGYVQTLAVKRLLPEWTGDRDLVARLRAEFKLLALLSHEHIVRVHGLTQIDGGLAILMEPVEGVDLGRIVSQSGALEPRVVLEIVSAVADALDAAWCTVPPGQDEPLTVVHRDIKPSNVMLTPRGGVKVMDFGVARATFEAREVETRSQQFGTARYMAPERWLDGHAGHKSDVFSLGVTLAEIATGEAVPRFRLAKDGFAEDRAAALARIGWEPLRALAERLLAFEPDERPTAAEVSAAALELLPEAPGPPLRVWAHGNVVVRPGEAGDATATMTVDPRRHGVAEPAQPGRRAARGGAAAAAAPLVGGGRRRRGAGGGGAAAARAALGRRSRARAARGAAGAHGHAAARAGARARARAGRGARAGAGGRARAGARREAGPAACARGGGHPDDPPRMAKVRFAVDPHLAVRTDFGPVVATLSKRPSIAVLSLPASQSVNLRIEEADRRWSCRIDVPPKYGEVAVHAEGDGGCKQVLGLLATVAVAADTAPAEPAAPSPARQCATPRPAARSRSACGSRSRTPTPCTRSRQRCSPTSTTPRRPTAPCSRRCSCCRATAPPRGRAGSARCGIRAPCRSC
ncbi:MAG: serine/threonine-protein kinase [Myxococcota bacterium]